MIDRGSGAPLVLIPGIQGRHEWMLPAIRALASRHRVLSFSLGRASGFDDWMDAIDDALDRAGEPAAAIVGVSFGGLIAARFAARRPERARALILVSTPSPRWRLDRFSAAAARHPWLSLPFFAARACVRLTPEILSARPSWPARLQLATEYAGRALRSPMSPSRMAGYVHAWQAIDLAEDCARVIAPTLVVTGEPHLDRVVPVPSSLEYLDLIAGARHTVLQGTGHVGLITKPEQFAGLIERFIGDTSGTSAQEAGAPARSRHAS